MKRPTPLRKGDKIGIIAPSSPPLKERIEPAIEFFRSVGLIPVIAGDLHSNLYGYLCGDDASRAAQINNMFRDQTIKGLFAIRGGHGASRILDKIDYELIEQNPKIFAGYSDITALHNIINQKCKLITYHTPMAAAELYKPVDQYTLDYFKQCIFESSPSFQIENPPNIQLETINPGKAEGIITGGNLATLAALIGTPYEIDTTDKILFLEDVDETIMSIERNLTHLRLSGKLDKVSGVILGYWTRCGWDDNLKSVFKDTFKNIPVLANLCCGHSLPTLSFPLGERFYMDADNCIIKKI